MEAVEFNNELNTQGENIIVRDLLYSYAYVSYVCIDRYNIILF